MRARERLGDSSPKVKIGAEWCASIGRIPRTAREAGVNLYDVWSR